MARSKREWQCAKFERYLKEGRGQGEGKNYIPWIQIHDFPSQGRSHRILGWKTGREHHLLSDLEKQTFYLFEWSDIVTDIREQYPLLNLDLAMSIADEMNFKYPEDSKHKTPYILTTDFLLNSRKRRKTNSSSKNCQTRKRPRKKICSRKIRIRKTLLSSTKH